MYAIKTLLFSRDRKLNVFDFSVNSAFNELTKNNRLILIIT